MEMEGSIPAPGKFASGMTFTTVCGISPFDVATALKKYPICISSAPPRDGCVGTSILPLEGAGTHEVHDDRCGAAARPCSKRSTNTPASACITSLTRSTTTAGFPRGSQFIDIAVRDDSWMRVPSASNSGSTGSKRGEVFMARSVPAMPRANNFNS